MSSKVVSEAATRPKVSVSSDAVESTPKEGSRVSQAREQLVKNTRLANIDTLREKHFEVPVAFEKKVITKQESSPLLAISAFTDHLQAITSEHSSGSSAEALKKIESVGVALQNLDKTLNSWLSTRES